jgi:hypothetical protein
VYSKSLGVINIDQRPTLQRGRVVIAALFQCSPNQRETPMLNRSVPSFFHGKASSERPFCADCESPMILSCLEPDKPGFDLRTYVCLMCAATESIVVAE